MMRKRTFLLVSLLLLFSASMPFVYTAMAETPKASEAVIIKFWYTEGTAEEPVLFDKITWFMQEYPDIDVVAQSQDFFGIGDAYRQAFIAGEDPDIVRAGRDNIPDFAEDGLILPVTDHFDNLSDFLEPSIALMTYKGEIWGMPQLVDSQIMMYNKDLFGKASITLPTLEDAWDWTEFNTNIALLNATVADGVTETYATSLAGPFFSVQPYYYGKSAEFFTDFNYTIPNIAINSTASRTALTELFDLIDGDYTPPWAEQGWANFVGDFGRGEVAMIATGPWQVTDLITNHVQFNGTEHGPSNLGFMQMPNDGESGVLIGGQYYAMSSHLTVDSAEYNATVTFMQWLTSHNMQAYSAIENTHAPSRKSVMLNATVIAAPTFEYIEPFYEQAKAAKLLDPHPLYGQFESTFGDNIGPYLSGTVTLDELITDTTLEWIDLLTPEAPPPEPPKIPGFTIPALIGALVLGVVVVVFVSLKKKKN